jgi:hypothetical protein
MEVVEQVGADARARVDADRQAAPARRDAGILERLPGAFEQQPLLRVHELGLAVADAEQRGVEAFDVVEHAGERHVGGVRDHGLRNAGGAQLRRREPAIALAARAQVGPQLVEVAGARETPRHAQHGDPLGGGRGVRLAQRRSSRTPRRRRAASARCCRTCGAAPRGPASAAALAPSPPTLPAPPSPPSPRYSAAASALTVG